MKKSRMWVFCLAASTLAACSGGSRDPGISSSPTGQTAGGLGGSAGSSSGLPAAGSGGTSGASQSSSAAGNVALGGSGIAQAGATSQVANQASPLCQRACQKIASAGCGDVSATDCSECPSDQACQGELDAYGSCVVERGTPSCEGSGTTVAQCATEVRAYNACTACAAAHADTACESCGKTD